MTRRAFREGHAGWCRPDRDLVANLAIGAAAGDERLDARQVGGQP
jgi:hypothetical protein